MYSLIKSSLALGVAFFVSSLAQAQQVNSPEQIDTVYTFNEICYTKVPAVKSIEDMALELSWKPLDNKALAAFGDKEKLSYLTGWDVQVGEKFYRLGLSQGPVSQAVKDSFPDFADAVATSCTMVLDGSDTKEEIATNMQTLAGKEPATSNVDEGELLTTTWAGGNNDFKVFLLNKEPKEQEGGLINVTVISKN